MYAPHHGPDGPPAPRRPRPSDDPAAAALASEPRCPACDVVEPLLRRSDLLSQLLWLGRPFDCTTDPARGGH